MTLLTLYTGQTPKDPLVLPVTKSDGTPVDLTLYDTVEVLFRHPDGQLIENPLDASTTVQNTNEAVYNWSQDPLFGSPGDYSVTVRMEDSGVIDFSSKGIIAVETSLMINHPGALVTAEEVYHRAGVTVKAEDIAQAVAVIEDELGMDLSVYPFDEEGTFFEDLSANDLRYLVNAIIWETKYLQEHPEALQGLSGIESASVNGVGVKFAPGASESFLAPLAAKCLRRLSWRKTPRTIVPSRPWGNVPFDPQEAGWVTQYRTTL